MIPQRDIEPPEPRYREDDYWIDQEIDARKDRESEDTNNEEENE
jgi:hypothetical protein